MQGDLARVNLTVHNTLGVEVKISNISLLFDGVELEVKSTILLQTIRDVCPNFGHPALTSSFTKKQLQGKNGFATIVKISFEMVSAFER